MINSSSQNYTTYIRLALVYVMVYVSTIYMLIALGTSIYVSVGISIVISIFVHDTLYNNQVSSNNKTNDDNQLQYLESASALKITRPNNVKIELNQLVGLQNVKQNLQNILNLIQVESKRNSKPVVGHYIFQGNPGTGKTTVGRILGKTFRDMKFLSNGHFIEVTRDDLVGQYQGHTAQKTTEILNSALGGVLFIDEAYSLMIDEKDAFGLEAINTIVPFMENHRDELILIIAGYTNKLDEFLSSNAGFKSRFDYTIDFEDYLATEQYEIFKIFAKDFHWSTQEELALKRLFKNMSKYKSKNFGNGRDVRKVFDKIKQNQSNRLAPSIHQISKRDKFLYQITVSDINKVFV